MWMKDVEIVEKCNYNPNPYLTWIRVSSNDDDDAITNNTINAIRLSSLGSNAIEVVVVVVVVEVIVDERGRFND